MLWYCRAHNCVVRSKGDLWIQHNRRKRDPAKIFFSFFLSFFLGFQDSKTNKQKNSVSWGLTSSLSNLFHFFLRYVYWKMLEQNNANYSVHIYQGKKEDLSSLTRKPWLAWFTTTFRVRCQWVRETYYSEILKSAECTRMRTFSRTSSKESLER